MCVSLDDYLLQFNIQRQLQSSVDGVVQYCLEVNNTLTLGPGSPTPLSPGSPGSPSSP